MKKMALFFTVGGGYWLGRKNLDLPSPVSARRFSISHGAQEMTRAFHLLSRRASQGDLLTNHYSARSRAERSLYRRSPKPLAPRQGRRRHDNRLALQLWCMRYAGHIYWEGNFSSFLPRSHSEHRACHGRDDRIPQVKYNLTEETKMLADVQLNIRISRELKDAIELAARRDQRSLSGLIKKLLTDHCRKQGIKIIGREKKQRST